MAGEVQGLQGLIGEVKGGAAWVCLEGEPGAGDGVKGWWGYCSQCGGGRVWEGQGWGAYKPSVPPMDDAKTTPSTTQQMMIMIFFLRALL